MSNSSRVVRVTFEVPEVFAPALRSAVEEFSIHVAGRVNELHPLHEEKTLTQGIACIAALRAAVNKVCPAESNTWPRKAA